MPDRTSERYLQLQKSICNPIMTRKHATQIADGMNFSSQLASSMKAAVKRA
jgi:hypothetical protein